MNALSRITPLAAALLLAMTLPAQAQRDRSVAPAPPTRAPAMNAQPAPGSTSTTAPGLNSQFPAGLPSPSPFPAGMPSIASPTLSLPGTPATTAGTVPFTTGNGTTAAVPMITPPGDGTVFMPATGIGATAAGARNAAAYGAAAGTNATMGAAGGVPSTGQSVPSGRGPFTALQLAESFQRADANRDGELTRAEFQRLTIVPASFEEMDRNRDGVISRSEYEDASR